MCDVAFPSRFVSHILHFQTYVSCLFVFFLMGVLKKFRSLVMVPQRKWSDWQQSRALRVSTFPEGSTGSLGVRQHEFDHTSGGNKSARKKRRSRDRDAPGRAVDRLSGPRGQHGQGGLPRGTQDVRQHRSHPRSGGKRSSRPWKKNRRSRRIAPERGFDHPSSTTPASSHAQSSKGPLCRPQDDHDDGWGDPLGVRQHQSDSRSGGKTSTRKNHRSRDASLRAGYRPPGPHAQTGPLRGTQEAMPSEDMYGSGKASLDRHARRHSFSGQPEYVQTSRSWSSLDLPVQGLSGACALDLLHRKNTEFPDPSIPVGLPQAVTCQPKRVHPGQTTPTRTNARLEFDDVTQYDSDSEGEKEEEEEEDEDEDDDEEEEEEEDEDEEGKSSMDYEKHPGSVDQTPVESCPTLHHFHGQANRAAMFDSAREHPVGTCEGRGLPHCVPSYAPISNPDTSSGGMFDGIKNTVSGVKDRFTDYFSRASPTSKQLSHPGGYGQPSYQALEMCPLSGSNPSVAPSQTEAAAHPNTCNSAAHHCGFSYNSYHDDVHQDTDSAPEYGHGGLSLLKQKKLLKFRSDQATYQMIYDIYLRAVGVIECFEWREHGQALLQNGIQLSESSAQLNRETQNRTHDEVRPGLCICKGAWVGE